jgi:hypothetical protein
VLRVVGDREAAGRTLWEMVAGIQGVAGTTGDPTLDNHALLERAYASGGYSSVPFDTWLETALVAGWLAAQAEHLVTHRVFNEQLQNPVDFMLAGQLVRLVMQGPEQRFDEALAQVIVSDYMRRQRLESVEIGRAAQLSMSAAREQGNGLCGFLLDGIKRGEELVRDEPGTMLAVLMEMEDRLERQEEIFCMAFEDGIGRASDAEAWRKVALRWTRLKAGGKAKSRGGALWVIRMAYDGMFWFGATREMNRTGTTRQWIDKRIASTAAQAAEAEAVEPSAE